MPERIREFPRDRGVPENDTETRMPSDPTVEFAIGDRTGAENSIRPGTAPAND
jgi:hypothetical protein